MLGGRLTQRGAGLAGRRVLRRGVPGIGRGAGRRSRRPRRLAGHRRRRHARIDREQFGHLAHEALQALVGIGLEHHVSLVVHREVTVEIEGRRQPLEQPRHARRIHRRPQGATALGRALADGLVERGARQAPHLHFLQPPAHRRQTRRLALAAPQGLHLGGLRTLGDGGEPLAQLLVVLPPPGVFLPQRAHVLAPFLGKTCFRGLRIHRQFVRHELSPLGNCAAEAPAARGTRFVMLDQKVQEKAHKRLACAARPAIIATHHERGGDEPGHPVRPARSAGDGSPHDTCPLPAGLPVA